MKKGMVFLAIVVFVVTLAMPVLGAEAPKAGTQLQQQTPAPLEKMFTTPPDLIVLGVQFTVVSKNNSATSYTVEPEIKNIGGNHAGPFKITVNKQRVWENKWLSSNPPCHNQPQGTQLGPWEPYFTCDVYGGLDPGKVTTCYAPRVPENVLQNSQQITTAISLGGFKTVYCSKMIMRWKFQVIADSSNSVAEFKEHNNELIYDGPGP